MLQEMSPLVERLKPGPSPVAQGLRERSQPTPTAMHLHTELPTLHNFLFMLPACTTPAEQEVIVDLARRLTALGFVYIATPHVETMTDREDIRFMPFHRDMLPSFGTMTGVFVVRDQVIAAAAQTAYPEAHVLIVDPVRVAEDLPEYEPETIIGSWPAPRSATLWATAQAA